MVNNSDNPKQMAQRLAFMPEKANLSMKIKRNGEWRWCR